MPPDLFSTEAAYAQRLGFRILQRGYNPNLLELHLTCAHCHVAHRDPAWSIYKGVALDIAREAEVAGYWFGKNATVLCESCFLDEVERVAAEVERDLVEANEAAERRAA